MAHGHLRFVKDEQGSSIVGVVAVSIHLTERGPTELWLSICIDDVQHKG